MPLPRPLQSLRVRSGEPIVPTLVTVCHGLRAHSLRSGALRSPETSVHQLRLVAKALRAIIRITGGGRPARDFVRLDRSIRLASSNLAGARDNSVQAELLARLVRSEPRRVSDAARHLADSWPDRSPGPRARAQAARNLATCADEVAAGLEGRVDPPGIIAAVGLAVRKTRRWRLRASRRGEPSDFHAWRRWQKRLEAHFRLVLSSESKGRKRRLSRLHRLQEELGFLHDADQLVDRLARERWPEDIVKADRERITRLATRRSERLRKRILKRSGEVFAGDIPQLARRVTRQWRAPHAKPSGKSGRR